MRMCKCNKIINGARWVGKDILILLAIVDYIICTLYILSFYSLPLGVNHTHSSAGMLHPYFLFLLWPLVKGLYVSPASSTSIARHRGISWAWVNEHSPKYVIFALCVGDTSFDSSCWQLNLQLFIETPSPFPGVILVLHLSPLPKVVGSGTSFEFLW